MIRDIVWACLECGTESSLDEAAVCRSCGARYRRGNGAAIVVNDRKRYEPREVTALLPDAGSSGTADCTVRESVGDHPVRANGHYLGRVEKLGPPRAGRLTLDADRLHFEADEGADLDVDLLDITAIQPSSHALQIKTVRRPVFSIRFTDSSPKLWEERLQNAINAAFIRAGRGAVVEFQPRICTQRVVVKDSKSFRARKWIDAGRDKRPVRPWLYRLCSWIARTAWRYFGGGVHVKGRENIPATGPFLVLPNHQSYLETMLVPAVIERPIYAMAKSTQFNVPFFGWLMAQVFAFPVRRFEIDPQAVRFLLRRFSEGYGAVVFIEGERTWDGDVQPARHGVIRLALKTGVPVIPCRVDGAFEAWPRWSGRPKKQPVHIRFDPPLELPKTTSRAEREAALQDGLRRVCEAINK